VHPDIGAGSVAGQLPQAQVPPVAPKPEQLHVTSPPSAGYEHGGSAMQPKPPVVQALPLVGSDVGHAAHVTQFHVDVPPPGPPKQLHTSLPYTHGPEPAVQALPSFGSAGAQLLPASGLVPLVPLAPAPPVPAVPALPAAPPVPALPPGLPDVPPLPAVPGVPPLPMPAAPPTPAPLAPPAPPPLPVAPPLPGEPAVPAPAGESEPASISLFNAVPPHEAEVTTYPATHKAEATIALRMPDILSSVDCGAMAPPKPARDHA
jgi:hypothetical protein